MVAASSAPVARRVNLGASYFACEKLARASGSSFYPAFWLLSRSQYRGMCALYAFLRRTDDLVDGDGLPADKYAALRGWREALGEALGGEHRPPLLPALVDAVRRFKIPPEYLHAAIDGAEMDIAPARFETFEHLSGYCYRAASVVGLCCLRIWECESVAAQRMAHAAGLAFQLTNILRDLGEDLGRGRVYLPREDTERFTCPPERWAEGGADLTRLLGFQIARAREWYRECEPLSRLLKPAPRAAFEVMWRTYRQLLDEVERIGPAVLHSRPRLGKRRKLGMLLLALPTALGWRR